MMNPPQSIGALSNIPKDVPSPEAIPTEGVQNVDFSIDDYNTPYTFLDSYRRKGGNILEAIVPLQDAFQIDRDQAIPIISDYVKQFSGS